MSPTRTLLRADLRWAVPLGIIGLLFHLLGQLANGLHDPWVFPVSEWANVSLSFYMVAAAVLGLVATVAEEVTRTREYRLHRPLSPAQLFLTRHGLGFLVLTAWILLVPTLHFIAFRLFSRNADLGQPGRWWWLVAQGLPAYLFYALGVFTAAVTRTYWAAAILAFAATGIAAGYLLALTYLIHPGKAVLVMVACSLVAPLLLRAAYRCQCQGRDPDRPWTVARLLAAGPALLVISLLMSVAALTTLHFTGVVGLFEIYPRVARHDGQYLLRRWDVQKGANFQLDDQHRWGKRLKDEDLPNSWTPIQAGVGLQARFVHPDAFPGGGKNVKWSRGRMFTRPISEGRRQVFISSDGHMYIYRLRTNDSQEHDQTWVRKLGKGPENLPFSSRARVIAEPFDRITAVLESDGSIWEYDVGGDAPSFVERPLPGGDRYVSTDTYRAYMPLDERVARPNAFPLVVTGERGRYALGDGGWKVLPASTADTAQRPALADPEVQYFQAGRWLVTLKDRQGNTVFQHHYQPHTFWEKALALLVDTPTLLRPPITTLPSALVSQDAAYRPGWQLLLDPAVILGARAALVGNLLLSLALAGFTFARLRRLGLPPGRRLFWTLSVVGGGLAAFLCARWVETDRAWSGVVKEPAQDKPAPARLLFTA